MKKTLPPNYGFDFPIQWKNGDFKVGDAVVCGMQNLDYGIVSFISNEYLTVCTACGTGTDELPHRDIKVVVSKVVPIRKLEKHEYTKLATSLKKGCQTETATSKIETGKEKTLAISHTLRKRVEEKPVE
tara:strand:- start:3667 stop:4053 length:387 start_codon:yes stop_codon:yes gene_type:complete